MKPRDAQIPLLLWLCAAIVAHFVVSGSAEGVKRVEEKLDGDRAAIRSLVHDVRGGISPITEVVLDAQVDPTPPPAGEVDAKPKDAEDVEATPDDASKDTRVLPPKDISPKPPEPERLKPPEPKKEEVKPPPPPPPEPKKEEPKKEEPKKEVVPIPVEPDKRIAVALSNANNVTNDAAKRLAETANKVEEETMARERVQDQDYAHPTAGTNAVGPQDKIGHSTNDKVGQAEEHTGDPRRAPGEAAKVSTDITHEAPKPPSPTNNDRSGGPHGGGAQQLLAPSEASKGATGGLGQPAPDAISAPSGGWSMDPANPGGDGKSGAAGKKSKQRDFVPDVRNSGFSLPGAPGLLSALGGYSQFENIIGKEQLQREREAVGIKIRQEHAGRLDTNKFERWRPAIENYDPVVKLGNETALNAAASPFAKYLHDIHNRLHPIFGDEFLMSGVASSEGLDDMTLVTKVELILSKDEGKIMGIGIVQRSGSTIFDAVALEALDRASPFGKAPDIIVSPDGNVYLHWEFHRDPFDACSTRNAHPILLKNPPQLKPYVPARPVHKPSGKSETATDDTGPLLPLRKK